MTVVVLGMHRSGTSALTGALHRLGLGLGDESDLLGANQGNPKGHFELQSVIALNDDILAAWGGRWEVPPEFPVGWETSSLAQEQVARIRTLIDERGLRGAVVKDPRLSLLFPLWRQALDDEVVVVAMTRHPLEVAGSLASRDDIALPLGLSLWWVYNASMVRSLGGLRTYLLTYEALTVQPGETLPAVATSLATWGVAVDPARVVEATSFVDQGLRRERDATALDDEFADMVTLLDSRCGANDPWPVSVPFTPLRLPQALLTIKEADRQHLGRDAATIASLQSSIDELRATVDSLNGEVHHWHATHATLVGEAAAVEAQLQQAHVRLHALERWTPRGLLRALKRRVSNG